MRRSWCLPLAGLLLATGTLTAAVPASAAARPRIAIQQSETWAGYAAHHNTVRYNSVSGTWVQPTVSCSGKGSQAAFFAGLDDYANGFYEFTGTQVKCPHGTPVYSGWASLYPKPPVVFSNALRPGDALTASVSTGSKPGVFTTVLTDTTQGWTRTISRFVAFPIGESAEVIVDDPAPAGHGGPVPLADFGTVEFTNLMVNGQTMGDSRPTRILMVRNTGTGLKASITGLLAGTHFSVTWLHPS